MIPSHAAVVTSTGSSGSADNVPYGRMPGAFSRTGLLAWRLLRLLAVPML
jgi:hypothetical protein